MSDHILAVLLPGLKPPRLGAPHAWVRSVHPKPEKPVRFRPACAHTAPRTTTSRPVPSPTWARAGWDGELTSQRPRVRVSERQRLARGGGKDGRLGGGGDSGQVAGVGRLGAPAGGRMGRGTRRTAKAARGLVGPGRVPPPPAAGSRPLMTHRERDSWSHAQGHCRQLSERGCFRCGGLLGGAGS